MHVYCDGVNNGFISFAVTDIVASEDSNADFTTVAIPFVRQIGTEGSVLVTYKVMQCHKLHEQNNIIINIHSLVTLMFVVTRAVTHLLT